MISKRLISLSEFEEALLGPKPIILVFTSEFCHACTVFKQRLKNFIDPTWDMFYFELRRGDIPGLEKTFHLITTPALVSISNTKQIVCNRQCDQMSDQELKKRLEELL